MCSGMFKIMAFLLWILPNLLNGFSENLNSEKIKKEA